MGEQEDVYESGSTGFDKLPLVSVIMPVFNAEAYVEEAINSILTQTHQHFEILVGDDGSHDGTLSVVKNITDPRIRIFENATNLGSLRTRNKLLLVSKGDYIAFQDADDTCAPGRLQKQVDFLEANADYAGCFHDVRIIDSKGKTLQSNFPIKRKTKNVSLEDLIEIGNNSQTNSRVFRRTCIENMPQWYLNFASDLGLEVLIAEHGDWAYMDEVMSVYRVHASGSFTSAGKIKQTQFIFKSYQHLLASQELREKFEKLILFRLRHFALELARACKDNKKYAGYFKYLQQFIRLSPKGLKLLKFLIRQELFGRRDKPNFEKPAFW